MYWFTFAFDVVLHFDYGSDLNLDMDLALDPGSHLGSDFDLGVELGCGFDFVFSCIYDHYPISWLP